MSDVKLSFNPTPGSRERFRPTTPRPLLVEIAFWVLLALCALLVAGYVFETVAFLGKSSFASWLLGIVLILGPPITLTVFVRRGIGWARVVLTIGVVWNTVGTFILALTQSPHYFEVLVVFALAAGVPMVFLWLPSSSAFFRAVAEEKRQHRKRQLR